MASVSAPTEYLPVVLHLSPAVEMTDEEFFQFCQLNRDLRIERTAEGDLIIMPPAGGEASSGNARLTTQVSLWAKRDGSGVVFDSSGGFNLPNGATRSPDVAWVKRSRLARLTAKQKRRFLPLCPDFVLELRSPSDRLVTVKQKMQEYLANGAQLGWLIDAPNRRVFVYRPGAPVKQLDNPAEISGDSVLPGFVLSLDEIWEAGF